MNTTGFAVVAALAGAACSHSASGTTTGVVAYAGKIEVEEGATIVSHYADGSVIDEEMADSTGRAEVKTAPGAYVSVIFPGEIVPTTPTITVVTALLPTDGADLVIHGPPHPLIFTVVAGLTVMPDTPLAGATAYTVDLGCTTTAVSAMPAFVDVIAPCEGTDTNLDVLVRGYDTADPATQQLLGYTAGRVPTGPDQAGNESAQLEFQSWSTSELTVPITQTGVSAAVSLQLISDTLPFPTPPTDTNAYVWDNLVVDSSIVTAALGSGGESQITMQYGSGAPTAIALAASDFLPALSPGLTLADPSALGFTWANLSDSALGDADTLDLHVVWDAPETGSASGPQIVWDVVAPPDSDQMEFPQLDSDLQQEVPLPTAPSSSTLTVSFSAIDSPALNGYGDLQAAGIDEANAIVPLPVSGEIRTSVATGFAQ